MSAPDPDAVALAHRLFDLARSGDTGRLAYLDAGVTTDLTDAPATRSSCSPAGPTLTAGSPRRSRPPGSSGGMRSTTGCWRVDRVVTDK
jgi:hypothetical protein